MAIPLATATMDIYRQDPDTPLEDRGPDSYVLVTSGVRCHVSSPSGSTAYTVERTNSTATARLTADLCDLKAQDQIKVGDVFYDVLFATVRSVGPIPHTAASLREVL